MTIVRCPPAGSPVGMVGWPRASGPEPHRVGGAALKGQYADDHGLIWVDLRYRRVISQGFQRTLTAERDASRAQ